jgi:hypothetical protein
MALARELPASPRGDLVSRLPSWRDALPDRPNRLLLRDTLGLPETVALQDGRTPWLPTPIRSLQPTTAHQLRWVAEVAVRDWCAIRHPTLGPQLLARTQTIASTSSRGAIAASRSTRRPGGPRSDRRGVPRRAGEARRRQVRRERFVVLALDGQRAQRARLLLTVRSDGRRGGPS